MSTISADELRSHIRSATSRHPVNQIYSQASLGERLADKIATGIGSWSFLIVQTILVLLWVGINLLGLSLHWDPYPFILLNLMFSVQAAYTGPVLLLAGNRQAQKDRLTLEHACLEAERTDSQDAQILAEIKRNTELTVTILEHIEGRRKEQERMAAES
jgi:uncharacterized membrane protein